MRTRPRVTNSAIAGTPLTTSGANFTITATDSNGCSGSLAYTLGTVTGSNAPTLNLAGLAILASVLALVALRKVAI